MTDQLRDKFRGVLLGMACGDALGAQVEFKRRGTFTEQRDMTGGGPHRLKAGQWTDDTAMALHLAEHLLVDPHVDRPGELADRWVRWMVDGHGSCTGHCFDVGTQTRASLAHWAAHDAAPRMHAGQRGNGALMRVAPVALAHYGDRGAARTVACNQARVTHPQSCAELCATFTVILQAVMQDEDGERAVHHLAACNRPIARRLRADVDSSGYDVATYEAALWAVMAAQNLEDAVQLAVNLGDDADTVGAVAGALAGATWGATGIPSRWLTKLAWGPRILELADEFYNRSVASGS